MSGGETARVRRPLRGWRDDSRRQPPVAVNASIRHGPQPRALMSRARSYRAPTARHRCESPIADAGRLADAPPWGPGRFRPTLGRPPRDTLSPGGPPVSGSPDFSVLRLGAPMGYGIRREAQVFVPELASGTCAGNESKRPPVSIPKYRAESCSAAAASSSRSIGASAFGSLRVRTRRAAAALRDRSSSPASSSTTNGCATTPFGRSGY